MLLSPDALAQGAATAPDAERLEEEVKLLRQQIDKMEAEKQATGAPPSSPPKAVRHVVQSESNKFAIESSDGQYSIALTGRLNIDVGGYPSFVPDNAVVGVSPTVSSSGSVTGIHNLSSGWNARRARIGVTGKAGGVWTYQFIYDGGNSQDTTAAGIQWAQVAYVGFKGVQIDLPGYSEVPFTLDYATSSNDTMFLERSAPTNIAASLGTGDFRANTGVRFYGDRYWVGAYLTGPQSSSDTHTNVRERLGAFQRITGQVLSNSDYSLLLGGGVFELLKAPDTGTGTPNAVTLSDRPELRIDPTALLTTGTIGTSTNPVTGATVYNAELAGGWRSLFFQGEYYHENIQRRGLSSNNFDGVYAQVGWVLTGEHRKYNPVRGCYLGITPASPVGPDGGTGAWEIGVRYSYTNLTDEYIAAVPLSAQPNAVNGGRLENVTVGVNWYVSSYLRLMLNYVHSELDKANGTTVAGAPLGVPVGYKFDAIALRTQVVW